LLLITDHLGAKVAPLVAHAQTIGASEISVPRKIMHVTEVPVLGTGKTDYVTIQRLAETDNKAA
jgi:acyl-[acyl-carrier-protein]-phospholipid O-acyltransferase/long-chain-fatty-acid--[acyl-carrier-protein] ligase